MLNLLIILNLLLILTLSIPNSFAENNEETNKYFSHLVNTENGPLQGVIKSSRNDTKPFVAFLGLRYANIPARFESSVKLTERWSEPRKADKPGSSCPQISESGTWMENEDCLFLNVYVPQRHLENEEYSGKLPVMVFIHGGGFSFGDGTGYGAEYFMENEDVILVTINYRLGILGFLTMEDDVFPSNNGLRDQVMALRWVKENIAAFKGDPENVTIFGNSAGSASVHYLLLSEFSKGLFHKAIMQSGAFSFWSYSPNPRETALKLAANLNCPDSSEDSIKIRKCLESKTPKELLIAQATFWPRWPTANVISRFGPTDKESSSKPFFPNRLQSFFTKRGSTSTEFPSRVPVMIGTTRDEGSTLFAACVLDEEGALEKLDSSWDDLAPKTFCFEDYFPSERLPLISQRVRKFYFGNQNKLTEDNLHFLSTLYTDTLFLLPVIFAGVELARQEDIQVYPYVFSFVGGFSLRDALKLPELRGKIGHADELQYLFPHDMLGPPLEPDSIAEKLSKRLVKLWTSFAKTGVTAASDWTQGLDIVWEPIKISSKKSKKLKPHEFDLLRIDTKLKLIKSEFTDRLNFWQDLLNEVVFDDGGNKNAKTDKTKTEL